MVEFHARGRRWREVQNVIAPRHRPFGGHDNPVSEQLILQTISFLSAFHLHQVFTTLDRRRADWGCQCRSTQDGMNVTNQTLSSTAIGQRERQAAVRGSLHDPFRLGSILCTALQGIVRDRPRRREPSCAGPLERGDCFKDTIQPPPTSGTYLLFLQAQHHSQ
jgi:hypothetical protein